MLGEIETLPSAEPKFLANHRDVERYAGEHRLDVSRHIVRPFNIVHPAGIGGCEPLERGDKIALHIRIGVLLDDERRRRVAQKKAVARRPWRRRPR